ncbi:MAG TPA: pyridoxal phosphate-dependent aminotransferase [Candidatus Acidoferrum sp.]|nr:pyridoxal phosphate-dependent aminotransferase [Candidatus Acidoferrum sp.]
MQRNGVLPPRSRRAFLQLSAAASAAVALRAVTEPMLAHAARISSFHKDAVMIDSNENPLGPGEAAREAVAGIVSQGGRYCPWLTEDLESTIAELEGLKPEYVRTFPGSSSPLHYAVLAYTSPAKSYVTADPGYEAGMMAAMVSGARIVKVGLTKSHAHDMRAMLAAARDAGVFYICSPNNPTGTLTDHSDIEYLLENKPKKSILLIDEAYIHFSDAKSTVDLVKADKDVVVLRTFSKIYGMAGLRCGFALGRPDLLAKLDAYTGWNSLPITAMIAAMASLKDAQLVPQRKRINATIREAVFQWLDRQGYSYIPSQSNCFMLDVKRPAKDVIAAMALQNVFIGRVWPAMPTYARITVGTGPEMERFQAAFQHVMTGAAAGRVEQAPVMLSENVDGAPRRATRTFGTRLAGYMAANSNRLPADVT